MRSKFHEWKMPIALDEIHITEIKPLIENICKRGEFGVAMKLNKTDVFNILNSVVGN